MGLKEDMISLRELQDLDLQISKIDEEILLGQQELDKRKATIAEREKSVQKFDEKIQANEARRRELEAEVEDDLVRIKDRQNKLMNVQTNREYQSLLKEIEEAKKANKQREDEIVLLMEHVDTLNKNRDEQATVCETEKKLLVEEMEKVEKGYKDLNTKKAKVEKSREGKVDKASTSSLKKYEMLRAKRNGVAIVGVTDGVCQGCFMNVPPQLYNDVIKEERILACPTCNRLLFHQPRKED